MRQSCPAMTAIFSLLFVLAYIAEVAFSQNVIENFCRRIGHSSVFKDGKISINGGSQTYTEAGSNLTYSGILDVILSIDMTGSWDASTNISFTQTAKSMSKQVPGYKVPLTVSGGSFYGGRITGNVMWQFGGTTNGFNKSAQNYQLPPNTDHPLWKYDAVADSWSSDDTSSTRISMPAYGAVAEAAPLGLGFYLGGVLNLETLNTVDENVDPDSDAKNTTKFGNMVVINTDSGHIANVTIKDQVNSNRRGARMVYVDLYGTDGLLILMGGHDTTGLVSFGTVAIFDVGTLQLANPNITGPSRNTWYVQTTSGDIPLPRRDFCVVQVTSQDNSSVSVYLYGGRAPGLIADDVYILSLPSFTWIKVASGETSRWGHTCHKAGNRQMISLGGTPGDYLAHCDPRPNGVGVLDMSTLAWSTSFNAYAQPYQVPDKVVAEIGGTATGGANKTKPDAGFDNDALASLFVLRSNLSPNTTIDDGTGNINSGNSSGSSDNGTRGKGNLLSTGAIAGIAIGVTFLILGGFFVLWLVCRRRWKNKQEHLAQYSSPSQNSNTQKRPDYGRRETQELSNYGQERPELEYKQVRAELSGVPLPPSFRRFQERLGIPWRSNKYRGTTDVRPGPVYEIDSKECNPPESGTVDSKSSALRFRSLDFLREI